jgi:lysophospholipase L1-like esterase
MRTIAIATFFAVAGIVSGCGSDTNSHTGGTAGSGGSGGGTGGNGAGGNGGSGGGGGSSGDMAGGGGNGGSGGSGGGGGSGGSGGVVTLPASFATYIELGDSISDGGGSGPFYYNLLYSNDDTTYPAWHGLDLQTKFGVQQHVHGAVAGSQTKDLVGQVMKLAATLPGPILVTVTSGGNDLQAAAQQAIKGTDGTYIAAMTTNIDSFLAAITATGRFGAGVEVYILFANIYDPTDKSGNFMSCPLPLSLLSSNDAAGIWTRWNAPFTSEAPKYPNVVIEPLYDTFLGHGIHDTDNWFYTDCIHPDTKGHHQIRRMFWKALTGADGPS